MSTLHEMAEALHQYRTSTEAGDKASAYQVMAEAEGVAVAVAKLAGNGSDECEDCGLMIPRARRKAAPWAVRCVDCQSLREGRRHG